LSGGGVDDVPVGASRATGVARVGAGDGAGDGNDGDFDGDGSVIPGVGADDGAGIVAHGIDISMVD
jgi:hypothetical protein